MSDEDDSADLAEYVLGTLPDAERRALDARLGAEPALRDALMAWQLRIAPLAVADTAGPGPSPDLWGRIAAAIAPMVTVYVSKGAKGAVGVKVTLSSSTLRANVPLTALLLLSSTVKAAVALMVLLNVAVKVEANGTPVAPFAMEVLASNTSRQLSTVNETV